MYIYCISHIIQLTPQQQSAEPRNSVGAEALAVARRPKEASRRKDMFSTCLFSFPAGSPATPPSSACLTTYHSVPIHIYIYIYKTFNAYRERSRIV